MTRRPVRRIGRYDLLRRIGAGGMGEVWLSRMPSPLGIDKVCVVKTILPHLAADRQFVGRFLDEAKVVVKLNHGNIAQVFEMGHADGQYFMAMEYVEGKTLGKIAARLRERSATFPVGLALHIGMKICDGLAFAHKKADPGGRPLMVVHRDISPANVMVSYQGEVKIIDFGASLHAAKEEQTAPRVVIGNLAYMSPEQARKHPVDHRADIFSTGIVLWELIAWQPLPAGGDYVEKWRRAAYPKYDKPSSFQPAVPPEVDRVIMRALQANPNDRAQDADDFRDELAACLSRIDPLASQGSVSEFMRRLFVEEADLERRVVANALAGEEIDGPTPLGPGIQPVDAKKKEGEAGADSGFITDSATAERSAALGVPAGGSGPQAPAQPGIPALTDEDGALTDPALTLQAAGAETLALLKQTVPPEAAADSGSQATPATQSEPSLTPLVSTKNARPRLMSSETNPEAPAEVPASWTESRSGPRSPLSFRQKGVDDTLPNTTDLAKYYQSPRLTLILGAAVFLAAVLLGFLIVAAAAGDEGALPAQEESAAHWR